MLTLWPAVPVKLKKAAGAASVSSPLTDCPISIGVTSPMTAEAFPIIESDCMPDPDGVGVDCAEASSGSASAASRTPEATILRIAYSLTRNRENDILSLTIAPFARVSGDFHNR